MRATPANAHSDPTHETKPGQLLNASPRRRQQQFQHGFALIVTMVAMSLVLLTLLSALTMTQYSGALIHRQLLHQGQALNAASAGLVEGLDWYRRQATTVTTFDPRRDLSSIPSVNDTDEVATPPAIIRNFEVSAQGRVYGRYEVRTGSPAAGTGVIDLTTNRGLGGHGIVWQIESQGIIFVNNDPTKAFDVSPNVILSRRTVRTEIQRLAITLPASSALCAPAGSRVTLNNSARIAGGRTGAGITTNSGSVTVVGADLTGTPSQTAGLSMTSMGIRNVFGTDLKILEAIADFIVTTPTDLPLTDLDGTGTYTPQMDLTIINAGTGVPVVFDAARPIQGSGILIVIGDLTLRRPSSFSGLIYVVGNYTQNELVTVSGSVLLRGPDTAPAVANAVVTGTGDFAEIIYDEFVMRQIGSQLGTYRFSRTPYVP